MDIHLLLLILLIVRVITMSFLWQVIYKQLLLLRLPIEKFAADFRLYLSGIALALFLGNIYPTTLKVYYLFFTTAQPSAANLDGFIYSINSAFFALVPAVLLYLAYRREDDKQDLIDILLKRLNRRN